jgi:hypothetical protein
MKRTEEDWCKLLSEYRIDEESVRSFCDRHKINTSSYYYWRNRISKRQISPLSFLPVVTTESKCIDAVEVFTPNGMTLRFTPSASTGYVADIIKALV